MMTLGESQLALAALASSCAGEKSAVAVLRSLLRRVRPTLLPRFRLGAREVQVGLCPSLTQRATIEREQDQPDQKEYRFVNWSRHGQEPDRG